MAQDELLSVGMTSPLTEEVMRDANIPQEVKEDTQAPLESKTDLKNVPRGTKQSENGSREPKLDQSEGKKDTQSPDFKDYSNAAILAMQYQKEGIIAKDVEIGKDISAKDLKQILLESAKRESSEIENEIKQSLFEKGYDEDDLKYARLLRTGVDERELSGVSVYKQMAELDFDFEDSETEQYIPRYLEQYFKDSGIKDAKAIKKLVESEIEEDGGEEKVKEAKEFYGKLYSTEIDRLQKEAEAKEAQKEQLESKRTSLIKDTISKGQFGPFELTDEDKDSFSKYLFNSTEEVVGEDGKKHKVPGYYKDLMEYNQNTEQQLLMAYLMKNKFSFDSIFEKAKEEDKKDLLSFLDERTSQSNTQGSDFNPEIIFKV